MFNMDRSAGDPPVGEAEVLAARFDTLAEADSVREKIEALGYDPLEVSYITDPTKCSFTFGDPGSDWAKMGIRGVAGGGAVGAALTAAMGALGLGSIVLVGPIGVAAAAAMGGFVGVLLGAGMDSDQAKACEDAINAGALIMVVQTHSGDQERVRAALGKHIVAVEKDEYTAQTQSTA
jgi:hypothetical protein